METIVYGGAFDPPQLAHQDLVGQLYREFTPEKIVLVPSGPNTFKSYKTAEEHRQRIIRIFADSIREQVPQVELCEDFMLGKVPVTTTLEIDTFFRERLGYSPAQVFGVDVVSHMQSWDPSGRVERELPKIFVTRAGYEPDMSRVRNYSLFHPNFPEDIASLSSTVVREQIRNRIYSGLDPRIAEYIRSNNVVYQ